MLNFDAAQQQLLASVQGLKPELESLPLECASARVLAKSVMAKINVPPQDNSAMDGIAFKFSDYHADKSMPISDKIFAGMSAATLKPGTAVRLFTGSIIPKGADTVVLQEDCEFVYDADGELASVKITETPKQGQHIRLSGEDIGLGSEVVAAGVALTARHIGLLASVGVSHVEVYKALKVGLLATGDELVAAGGQLKSGQIFNSNLPMLTAQLESMGCLVDARHVADDIELIVENLESMAASMDVILTIGGVSVGEADLVKVAIERLGQLDLWKVAMKPGKPLSFGHISVEGKPALPLIGLPGNPVSAFATFELFARPFLQSRSGLATVKADAQAQYPIQLLKTLQPKREEFLRVRLCLEDGVAVLKPYTQQGSGVLSSVAWATGFARIPSAELTNDGDKVKYYPFS